MRVTIGRTATAAIHVDLQYKCSACGKENLQIETLEGEGYTNTVMGIDTHDVSEEARLNLMKTVQEVADPNNPHRFRKAGFQCKCSSCGHTEPWAKMNYHRWDKLTDFMRVVFLLPVIILTLAVVGSLFYYDHDVMEFSPVVGVFLAIAAIGAAGYFGILYRHSKNSQKMEALIAELPPESIPMIHPHSKERHDLFHKQQRAEYLAQFENASVATSEATYETWECAACGTKNSTKYAQCKKCGKFKGA